MLREPNNPRNKRIGIIIAVFVILIGALFFLMS